MYWWDKCSGDNFNIIQLAMLTIHYSYLEQIQNTWLALVILASSVCTRNHTSELIPVGESSNTVISAYCYIQEFILYIIYFLRIVHKSKLTQNRSQKIIFFYISLCNHCFTHFISHIIITILAGQWFPIWTYVTAKLFTK